ncbi:MAG: beta-lactamase family protein, partial [Defluviitaleaceae bacterium]|nr:beta-lactamase family protein [Defluviitaleaceae bacterium]
MQNFLKKTVATFTLIATIYTPAFANFYEPHQNRPLVTIIETILNEALGYEETSEMPQLAPFQNTINFALEIINARMEAHNVTGLTIALVDSEKDFTWAQGFGYANTNLNLPVNADTLFQIGSTSKPFTAIAIMQAVEIGLINLDNPVNTYLTDFIHDSVTVRQLLNNTSGIVTNFLRDFLTIGSIHGTAQFKDIIPFLNSTNLTFEPGTQFEYANNNWQLLGMILASVHGHENLFNGFVYETDSVLQNIGMERSTFMFSPYLTNIAMPHTSSELEQHGMYLVSQLPAGSMLSSANDMAIAMKYMLGGNLDYLMKSHTNNIEDLSFMPSMEWYGLGFMQINDGSLTTIGHGGNIVHYHTEMIMHPETGLGVFLSTNSTTGVNIASTTARDILLTAVNEKLGIENPIEYIIEETELE